MRRGFRGHIVMLGMCGLCGCCNGMMLVSVMATTCKAGFRSVLSTLGHAGLYKGTLLGTPNGTPRI